MSNKIKIPLVIFAGGKSSRMGEDKALLPFRGYSTMTEYQLCRFANYFDDIYISCKDSNKFAFDAKFLTDTNQEIYSPLIAIKSIFDRLHCTSFIALSVDTPFVSIQTLQKLIKANNANIVATVAFTDDIEPLCCVYNDNIIPLINQALDNDFHKLTHLLSNATQVKCEKKEFTNLNYKEEYLNNLINNNY